MAQVFDSPDFGTLTVPGAYSSIKVQAANAGTAVSGVIMLVGEADAGPDFSLIEDITQNFFGPDEGARLLATYKSGPIVDAYNVAIKASNDPNIRGSLSRVYVAKTNPSVKATLALGRAGLSDYATLGDLSYGELGNQNNSIVRANTLEEAPAVTFAYVPSPVSTKLSFSVNGQLAQTLNVSAKTAPSDLVGNAATATSLNGLTVSGLNTLNATGGEDRGALTGVVGNISAAVAGNSITLTLASDTWGTTPVVGDSMIIPQLGDYGAAADSVLIGAAAANAGAYIVTGVTTNTVTATKLRNDVAGNLVAPVAIASVAVADTTDVLFYSPVTVTNVSGLDRSLISTGLVTKTVAGSVSGSTLTLTLENGSTWGALPQANDLLLIPSTAPAAILASNANVGWYKVVSATSSVVNGGSTIVATRLSNGNPSAFAATALAATTDIRVFRPAISGVGKSLEVFDGSGTEDIASSLYTLAGGAVTFLSTADSPKLNVSASEYTVSLTNARSLDRVSESFNIGGDIVLKLGYHGGGVAGLTATCTIANVNNVPTLTTAVSGGTGANLSINLTKFKTVGDLAAYINSQQGYTCSVGSALFGQLLLTYVDATSTTQTILDKTTFSISSALKSQPGRVKRDGWLFYNKLTGSGLVMVNPTAKTLGPKVAVAPNAGLPDAQALAFFSGGERGATTNSTVTSALAALEKVQGNFLVPLFSQDATKDYALGLTDADSTYTIDDINAAVRSHVLLMSQVKRRRNRQAILSKKTSFLEAKLAANNIASPRCALVFQDFKFSGQDGLKQYQPYMGAVAAAGMQAAAGYRPIVKRLINTSGVLVADGSYSDQLNSNVEDALQNGLLVAERSDTGGFVWTSDQTTYATDSNFVYNSIQAVYVADLIALTVARRFEKAFVGQSLADISAGVMLSYLSAIMSDLKRLKWITSSDDAPAGWKDGVIQIRGVAAQVSFEAKLAGALYFIPITTMFSQVTQTASL